MMTVMAPRGVRHGALRGDDGKILPRQSKCLVHRRNSNLAFHSSAGPSQSSAGPSGSRSIFVHIPDAPDRPAGELDERGARIQAAHAS